MIVHSYYSLSCSARVPFAEQESRFENEKHDLHLRIPHCNRKSRFVTKSPATTP
jgi:hypothetical protein